MFEEMLARQTNENVSPTWRQHKVKLRRIFHFTTELLESVVVANRGGGSDVGSGVASLIWRVNCERRAEAAVEPNRTEPKRGHPKIVSPSLSGGLFPSLFLETPTIMWGPINLMCFVAERNV
ncbi:hypothetical protein M5D96_006245 [Drosophila gunungcola]|uniref:Uncharacterized protein n=1 Tax=Drosophila gunungcola TaxID=103775 RepID=A0A9P9YP44_9MUSC|nr:hypothetical protein M5D96_006245 [Drosophila gunungcola]